MICKKYVFGPFLTIFFIPFAGQHIKEFTDFLSKHTDTFQIIDECVVLVGCEDLQDLPLSERLHLPQPSIDTAGTQQMLDFFAQCIENKGMCRTHDIFISGTFLKFEINFFEKI